jgi:hypothetical protein
VTFPTSPRAWTDPTISNGKMVYDNPVRFYRFSQAISRRRGKQNAANLDIHSGSLCLTASFSSEAF